MRKFVFAAVAVLLSQAALADTTVVTPADNGKTFDLTVGQCIDVRLSSNAASTGYEWYLSPGLNEAMSLAARTVTTPGIAPPGTPVTLDFILCAAAPGNVPVTFANYRVWEKNVPPAATLRFTVAITP